jgi:putative ABC transport system permease protein
LASFRQAFRRLSHRPGPALVAVLTFGLGLGLTAASETIIYGLYDRPLPFSHSAQLVRVEEVDGAPGPFDLSAVPADDFRAWSEGQSSFDGLIGWYPVAVGAVVPGSSLDRYSAAYTTPNFFAVLGVSPVLGRAFARADALRGSAPVVIIGDRVWREVFGGDGQVVGKSLWVSGKPHTVVGVTAPGFQFPAYQHLWLPLTPDARQEVGGLPLQVLGRLRSGVSAGQAAAELRAILLRGTARRSGDRGRLRARVYPFVEGYVDGQLRTAHRKMFAGVLGLLLICCTNVASLLLASTIPRAGELAVRSALGARRRQVFVALLAEPLLLASGGAVLAAAIAWLIVRSYNWAHEPSRAAWEAVRFDGQSVSFIVVAAAIAALLAGTLPALAASAPADPRTSLQEGSIGGLNRRPWRVLRLLLVAQVALSCGLLVATGLTVKSLLNLLTIDFGFPTDRLLTAGISLYRSQQLPEPEGDRLMLEVVRRAAALPGIHAAALAESLPGFADEPRSFTPDTLEPSAAARPQAFVEKVSPEYFEALGLRCLAGRTFSALDGPNGARVAVVTETLARRFFAGAEVVGHRIRFTRGWYDVVGVVADSVMGGLVGEAHPPGVYLSLLQFPESFATNCRLILRTSGPPLAPIAGLKKAVAAVSPDALLYEVQSLDLFLARQARTYRLASLLFAALGASAFAIVMAGIYGITAFSTAGRRFEVGVRMAVGARAPQIVFLLVAAEALPILIGVAGGLLLALSLSGTLRGVLFKVEGWDSAVAAIVVAGIVVSGVLAGLVPARRALSVSPTELLKRGG